MYPEQIQEGLRPWQPKKLYFAGGQAVRAAAWGGREGRGSAGPADAPRKLTPVNTDAYDTLLGRTYAEIGTDARASHKCQGMG